MSGPRDRASAEAFAGEWIAAWNRRATLTGNEQLRAYWRGALGIPLPHFVLWDGEARALPIHGQRKRSMEVMRFGPDGLVQEGEAMYGAAAP